jgi:excisionase family DNA binding protein
MEDNHFQSTPEVAKQLGLGPYLSMTETAELLGCTTRTIRQMVADGRLRAYGSARNSCGYAATGSRRPAAVRRCGMGPQTE